MLNMSQIQDTGSWQMSQQQKEKEKKAKLLSATNGVQQELQGEIQPHILFHH